MTKSQHLQIVATRDMLENVMDTTPVLTAPGYVPGLRTALAAAIFELGVLSAFIDVHPDVITHPFCSTDLSAAVTSKNLDLSRNMRFAIKRCRPDYVMLRIDSFNAARDCWTENNFGYSTDDQAMDDIAELRKMGANIIAIEPTVDFERDGEKISENLARRGNNGIREGDRFDGGWYI